MGWSVMHFLLWFLINALVCNVSSVPEVHGCSLCIFYFYFFYMSSGAWHWSIFSPSSLFIRTPYLSTSLYFYEIYSVVSGGEKRSFMAELCFIQTPYLSTSLYFYEIYSVVSGGEKRSFMAELCYTKPKLWKKGAAAQITVILRRSCDEFAK